MKIPRVLVAAPSSGSGKTTVTLALLDYFTEMGRRVQAFKVGPDYVDPNFHKAITGRTSYNLDSWMESPEDVARRFFDVSQGSDVAVIEGVMGLFDGKEAHSHEGSSSHIAEIIQTPVLLVLDVSAMARSAAAIVLGFQIMARDVKIAGVICNRVGSEAHYLMVKEAIESETEVPCLGYLLKNSQIEIPERQLGLSQMSPDGMSHVLKSLRQASRNSIDFSAIEQLAEATPELVTDEPSTPSPRLYTSTPSHGSVRRPTVALAYDEAFWFYYPANLDLLRALGATILPFSPLAGDPIPREATHLYWGGGFPEEFLSQLASKRTQLQEYRRRILDGLPSLAECGGYMALHEAIWSLDGTAHDMVGVVPGNIVMTERLSALGYRTITVHDEASSLHGAVWRGHEFHYSRKPDDGSMEGASAYRVSSRGKSWLEGYATANLLSGYCHLYLPSNRQAVGQFLAVP